MKEGCKKKKKKKNPEKITDGGGKKMRFSRNIKAKRTDA